ncbi:MAG: helix-turn-helix domain-containing protein [Gammaproteobacteria bacterium]|nr:MAG: helix-turn-helix domain-containing protein [Gammaproteobacteria bacterium]
MQSWNVNVGPLPGAERQRRWLDAMQRLCLPIGQLDEPEQFNGRLSCLTSPGGVEFALVEADALEISGDYPAQQPAIWLTLLLEGRAQIIDRERQVEVLPGDLLFGPTGVDATLRFNTAFRQLFIKAPRCALSPRLIPGFRSHVGHIDGQRGIARVFSGMLGALAGAMDDVRPEELVAVELALTEFLVACIAAGEHPDAGFGVGSGVREACLQRVCQSIEARLGDPELNLATIAKEHGVSPRYLQKLFALAGKTFSSYVRTRRLERCRTDLVNPLYARLSISEICFRWGFNCSSHFSRAFREQYQNSPREYRRGAGMVATESAIP